MEIIFFIFFFVPLIYFKWIFSLNFLIFQVWQLVSVGPAIPVMSISIRILVSLKGEIYSLFFYFVRKLFSKIKWITTTFKLVGARARGALQRCRHGPAIRIRRRGYPANQWTAAAPIPSSPASIRRATAAKIRRRCRRPVGRTTRRPRHRGAPRPLLLFRPTTPPVSFGWRAMGGYSWEMGDQW